MKGPPWICGILEYEWPIKSISSRLDGAVPRDFIFVDFFQGVAVEARTVVSMGKKNIFVG